MDDSLDDQVAALREQVAALTARLDELEVDEEPALGRFPQPPPTTWYEVEEWVHAFVGGVVERSAGGTQRWCSQWYLHPEAATRLRLLYESYREIVVGFDAVSYARWWTDVLDLHLAALLDERGPFSRCTPSHHSSGGGLPIQRNPDPESMGWGIRPR